MKSLETFDLVICLSRKLNCCRPGLHFTLKSKYVVVVIINFCKGRYYILAIKSKKKSYLDFITKLNCVISTPTFNCYLYFTIRGFCQEIARVPTISQEFPRDPKNSYEFPRVPKSFQEIPRVPTRSQEFPRIPKNSQEFQEFPRIPTRSQEFPIVPRPPERMASAIHPFMVICLTFVAGSQIMVINNQKALK